jgi:hypothetical protein
MTVGGVAAQLSNNNCKRSSHAERKQRDGADART